MNIEKIFNNLTGKVCTKVDVLYGGVTNTTYKIEAVDSSYVIRFPGAGTNEYISRKDEIRNMIAAYPLGMVPEVVYSDTESGIVISRYIENNIPMKIEDIHASERVKKICKCLFELHCSKVRFSNEFNIRENICSYKGIIEKMGMDYPIELHNHIAKLEKVVDTIYDSVKEDNLVPCHGDPKLNNFLLQNEKIWMIDWEYSGMIEYYFDLVNLVMTNNMSEEQEKIVLETYEKCSGKQIEKNRYLMYKISTDYLWIFWHLIKMYQGFMIEYNSLSWRKRLNRALRSYALLEDMK